MSLYQEQQDLLQKLSAHIAEMGKLGVKLAEAEMEYKILLAKHVLQLREQGTAIGMIDKTAYGIPEVAKARLERDVAKVMYDVSQEAINGTKLKIRITENQIEREYRG